MWCSVQNCSRGLPGGPVVEKPPCDAKDIASVPGPGDPCAAGWLSPWPPLASQALAGSPGATATEAHAPRACAQEKEAPAVRSPLTTAGESSHAATKTHRSLSE